MDPEKSQKLDTATSLEVDLEKMRFYIHVFRGLSEFPEVNTEAMQSCLQEYRKLREKLGRWL